MLTEHKFQHCDEDSFVDKGDVSNVPKRFFREVVKVMVVSNKVGTIAIQPRCGALLPGAEEVLIFVIYDVHFSLALMIS